MSERAQYQLPKRWITTLASPPDPYEKCPRMLQGGREAHERLGLVHVVMPGVLYCCLAELEEQVKETEARQDREFFDDPDW